MTQVEQQQCGCVVAGTMALSFKKDLDKYKDLDEDEILNKLSAEEIKQLETALEEMDPEVRAQGGGEGVGGAPGLCRGSGREFLWQKGFIVKGLI